jgi:hypothetical protein
VVVVVMKTSEVVFVEEIVVMRKINTTVRRAVDFL